MLGATQPDSTHVYYNQNYGNQLCYVQGTNGSGGYVTTQQQQQQLLLQQQQQQQQHSQQHTANPYVYAYVPPNAAQTNSMAVASPSSSQVQQNQYYLHPSGNLVYVPRQV